MRSRTIRVLIALLLVFAALPGLLVTGQAQDEPPGENCRSFDEVEDVLCDEFLDFWDENGGLPVFGFPLTEAFEEENPDTGDTYLVQYFERQRFELHPENAGTVYNVLLGRLGEQVLEMTGRDWMTFEKMDPSSPNYMPVTGFAVAPEFWGYWSSHGLEYGDTGFSFRESLLLFGYPISAPAMETNADGDTVLTQWFERAVFEYHPDNDEANQVLLRRVGAEVLGLIEPPDDQVEMAAELVAEGLTMPVTMAAPPDDSGRLFIVDLVGKIWILMPDGTLAEEPFLDISDRIVELNPAYDERGVLGLAFHPDYAENGRFFVYYSIPLREEAPDDFDHTNVVSEFQVMADDANTADPDSEQILLVEDWPYLNHNAGTLKFGPDGYLYISTGDGGNRDDEGIGHVEDWYDANAGGNGQDIEQNLLGEILRIDVDAEGEMPYGIPADNPFVEGAGRDEIYAYGFRNPYRFSFDMGGDQRMFVGDAGQDQWEEIDVVEMGGNYGWNVKEGTHCFDAEQPEVNPEECPDVVGEGHPDAGAPLIDPVIEYLNANQEGGVGLVVVGGYVYRGETMAELDGRYIFGDWSAGKTEAGGEETYLPGRILISVEEDAGPWGMEEVVLTNMPDGNVGSFILGFGQDLAGEVYVLTTDEQGPTGTTGKVYRLVAPE